MSATTGLPTNFAVHFAEEEAEPMEPVGRSLLDEETDGAIDFTTERRVSHDQKQLTKKLSSVSMLVRQKISMSVYLSDGNPIEVACLDTDEAEEIIERTLATYHAMVKKGEKKDLGIEDDPAAFKLFMHDEDGLPGHAVSSNLIHFYYSHFINMSRNSVSVWLTRRLPHPGKQAAGGADPGHLSWRSRGCAHAQRFR